MGALLTSRLYFLLVYVQLHPAGMKISFAFHLIPHKDSTVHSFHLNSHTLTKLPKQVYKLEPLCTVQYPVRYEELLNSYHLNVHALNIKLQAYKLKHILRHKSGHHYLGNNDFFLQNLQCYYFTGLFHTR